MKKIITALLLLVVGTSAFAKIFIQAEVDPFGYEYVAVSIPNSETRELERYADGDFSKFCGLGTQICWEFNSMADTKFRPFVGGGIGLSIWGFPLTAIGGFNYDLVDFGPLTMDLMTTLKVGSLAEIFGNIDFFVQPSIDAVFMSNSKKGIYGGLGITSQITTDFITMKARDMRYYGVTTVSCHFFAGYRF